MSDDIDSHLSDGELRAIRAHAADPATLLRTMRHIANCASCAARMSEDIDAREVLASLRTKISDDDDQA